MEVVVHIPDRAVRNLPIQPDGLAKALLESYALEGYKAGRFTAHQIQELLGFETGMQVDAFLNANNVPHEMTLADFEEGRKALEALLSK